MRAFWEKYSKHLKEPAEKQALKMMKHELHKAMKDLEEGGNYCEHIDMLREMAEDFLEVKEYVRQKRLN